MGPRVKLVMCTGAIAMIALPSLASAHKIRHDSAVSAQAEKAAGTADTPVCLYYGPPFVGPCLPIYRVWGSVTSPRSSCIAGRTVTLYRVRDEGATEEVETKGTRKKGEYSFFLSWGTPPADEYYVDVAKRRTAKQRHRHVCRAARSSTVRFASP